MRQTATAPARRRPPRPGTTKGSLIGLATVRLPIGLTIIDCPVFAGEHGPWVTLPSRPSLDRDGRQWVVDGKKQFEPVRSWPSRDVAATTFPMR